MVPVKFDGITLTLIQATNFFAKAHPAFSTVNHVNTPFSHPHSSAVTTLGLYYWNNARYVPIVY